MAKTKVLVLFGGRSAEHEVSVESARNVISAMSEEKYDVLLCGITREGVWHFSKNKELLLKFKPFESVDLAILGDAVTLIPDEKSVKLIRLSDGEPISNVDIVFPVLHGPYGEDGTIQGFLRSMNVPFVGCDVLSSSICMDKDLMKRLLNEAGIKNADSKLIRSRDKYEFDDFSELGFPVFVKPANMGSSVGVTKVTKEEQLEPAINEALKFDTKVIVEKGIKGREIEMSVLGNDSPQASVPGEVHPNHEFYSYEAKYLDSKGAGLEIPAKLDSDQIERLKLTAINAYQALECEGLARVDMFLTESGEVYVNELNTMPGFTKISMYPKMWEASGIQYSDLIDRLIDLGIQHFQSRSRLSLDR